MTVDPVLLARIQFAFTISFHIIFPAFTIGLAGYLACVEGLYLKTKQKIYQEMQNHLELARVAYFPCARRAGGALN